MPVEYETPRSRLTREELRSLLLRTGRDLLVEEGLGPGGETFTFKRVFERIEADTGQRLSNASVIKRVWENQADFQADVLALVASGEGGPALDGTVTELAGLIDFLDISTPRARRESVRELCRLAGRNGIEFLLESDNWALWVAVWVAATFGDADGGSDDRDTWGRVRAALAESYERATSIWEEAVALMTAYFGLRLRPPLTVRQFTVAAGALSEGCSLRRRLDDEMTRIRRPTGPNGEVQEWTIYGIGLEALVDRFFEDDPDWILP